MSPIIPFLSAFSRRIERAVSQLDFGARSQPLALLVLSVLAYGLLIHRLGFYWDDWPWVWFSQISGPGGMLQIDSGYRPLAGELLWAGSLLADQSPLGWQVLNLIFRWLSALALGWMLVKVSPERREPALWVTLLFLVYPGFGQQYIAVNSSRHILPLALFFLSLGWMLAAQRSAGHHARRRPWLYTILALVSSFTTLLATDYYFGLELARPGLLWLALAPSAGSWLARLRRVVWTWLPYLGIYLPVVIWRFIISPSANYEITLVGEVASQPAATLGNILAQWGRQVLSADLLAWAQVFDFPEAPEVRLRRVLGYWLVVGATFILTLFYLAGQKHSTAQTKRTGVGWLVLGGFASVVGVLPFLAAGISQGLSFPHDRTTLPLAFGSALICVGAAELLARRRALIILLVSLAVALAAGVQFETAARYEQDWQIQASLYRQLKLRIPALEPNTALLYQYSLGLQDFRSTSNSLTPMLNWAYTPDFEAGRLPYTLLDLRTQADWVLPDLENQRSLEKGYGPFEFEAEPGHILVIQFSPPGCLQVLEPRYARLYPHLPDDLASVVKYSNPGLIQLKQLATQPLRHIFGSLEPQDWCDYYQLADAARQAEDWAQVAVIGDRAFELDSYPRQASERLPFVLGYGYTGRWGRAEELTIEALQMDSNTQPLLCAAWEELAAFAPESIASQQSAARMGDQLVCSDEK